MWAAVTFVIASMARWHGALIFEAVRQLSCREERADAYFRRGWEAWVDKIWDICPVHAAILAGWRVVRHDDIVDIGHGRADGGEQQRDRAHHLGGRFFDFSRLCYSTARCY